MGNFTEKINQLKQTKEKLKTCIINKNGIVNLNSTFREIVQGLNTITLISSGIIDKTITSYEDTNAVPYICDYVFASCKSLSTVSFPRCQYIGSYAFTSCYSLNTISFPVCESIGRGAFTSCYSLREALFPNCTHIGNYAFNSCSNLATISFPNCIAISGAAFQSCKNLSRAIFDGLTVPVLDTGVFASTPMLISSYLGYFGSIYVLASMVESFKTATNWTIYADRITSLDNLPKE